MSLLTYQTFATENEALHVAGLLQKTGISTQIIKKPAKLDKVFVGTDFGNDYELKIAAEDFVKANKTLYTTAANLEDIDPNHPLYILSDNELKDVITKPAEWGADNFAIAMALLQSRGIQISDTELQKMEKERTDILLQKKDLNRWMLVLGYGLVLYPCLLNFITYTHPQDVIFQDFKWYFPGFLGPVIAMSVLATKITLPNGRRTSPYTNKSITHALYILALNILSWLTNIIMLMFTLS